MAILMNESQLSDLRKDIRKTGAVTLVILILLFGIWMYLR
jgi:hypothetical protein